MRIVDDETEVDPPGSRDWHARPRAKDADSLAKTGLLPAARAAAAAEEDTRPEVVLRALETNRARVFFRAALVIDALVLAAMPVLPGPAWLRMTTAGFAAVCLAVLGLVLWALRDERRYTTTVALTAGVSCSILSVAIIYYLGLYSASATMLSVGIYFFGSSQSRVVARGTYVACAGLYLVGTALIALDVIPDLGIFSAAGVPHASRWYRVLMAQVVFGVTFYLARSARRSVETALERAYAADRMIRQRDAQLAEARGELDRALKPGEGRLSGQTVDRWRLGDVLGRGGMGEVYRSIDLETKEEVAIKILHPNLVEDAEHVERFVREARAAASVPSQHVAKVFQVASSSSGLPYMVMELLEGHDLAWHLRRAGQLELPQVVEIVEHTARALTAVRDAGVVHRDLKPGNLFLTDSIPRTWKVLDFGLSKIHGSEALTRDQAVGTPAYMSPEQVRGKEVDHTADLYALTSIAYRCITGRPPFSGDQVASILMDVLSRMPPSPREFVPIPVEVELVLAIGLAKRREERFAYVEELASALRLASVGELDPETRARGWSLLKRHPWGSSLGRAV